MHPHEEQRLLDINKRVMQAPPGKWFQWRKDQVEGYSFHKDIATNLPDGEVIYVAYVDTEEMQEFVIHSKEDIEFLLKLFDDTRMELNEYKGIISDMREDGLTSPMEMAELKRVVKTLTGALESISRVGGSAESLIALQALEQVVGNKS